VEKPTGKVIRAVRENLVAAVETATKDLTDITMSRAEAMSVLADFIAYTNGEKMTDDLALMLSEAATIAKAGKSAKSAA
jgi:hypothetical protein